MDPVQQTLQRLVAASNGAWTEIRRLAAEVSALRQADVGSPRPEFVEDIPGKRVPFVYTVQIAFDAASSGVRTTLTAQVSQDGPFVCTWVGAYWRPTAGVYTGFWRPVHGVDAVQPDGLGAFAIIPDSVDFEYEIQIGGPDRNWQNIPRASRDLFGAQSESRPHYFGIAGFFERSEVINVFVTMLRNPAHAGLLKFEFHGYKILQPIPFAG